VDAFNDPKGPPLFFISLKAGGTGLNLTAADYVIHYDPWWNPAVEDQATDRTHRIGQTKAVIAYKLITRNTVEEKILALQQKKRELASGVLGGGEDLGKLLSERDVEDLFRAE
jgi:SNF2 family DNA or RNA helicase